MAVDFTKRPLSKLFENERVAVYHLHFRDHEHREHKLIEVIANRKILALTGVSYQRAVDTILFWQGSTPAEAEVELYFLQYMPYASAAPFDQ